ncbi:hypothetical protein AABM38_09190 [Heyndrickxia sp. MSNUG]|uniref:hypothetical protein n=1 Tax=Heyndrickxia sp. MSNUG TaxID=3136677 RepID=UPI003C2CA569
MEVQFTVPWFTFDENPTYPLPENYNYWVPLTQYYLKKTNLIEIHCWNEEKEILTEINSLFGAVINVETNLTIFKFSKNRKIEDYLTQQYKVAEKFKWFTVNFYSGSNVIFHSGHWATEFVVLDPGKADMDFIKAVTPSDTNFLQY